MHCSLLIASLGIPFNSGLLFFSSFQSLPLNQVVSSFISFREIDVSTVCSIQPGDNLSYSLMGAIVSRTKNVLVLQL